MEVDLGDQSGHVEPFGICVAGAAGMQERLLREGVQGSADLTEALTSDAAGQRLVGIQQRQIANPHAPSAPVDTTTARRLHVWPPVGHRETHSRPSGLTRQQE